MDLLSSKNFASNILTKLSIKVFSHIKSLAFFCVRAESRDIAHQSPVCSVSPEMSSDRGQRCHFPSELSPPSLRATHWRRFPRMHLLNLADWPCGSALVNHAFSCLCGFWTQAGGCEERLRDESQLCIWVHLCAFMAANSISRPSPILMQTSGWIATLYTRGKAPGRPVQTQTDRLYGEKPKHHFLFVLIINNLMTSAI